ncbi:MAG: asparagine synthase (glutamine-hydrolyzing) [Chloroflexi bacterium]|nr:asparagine synthase (glutamine-hydrolyzing) [Chloroflexota bacterium]
MCGISGIATPGAVADARLARAMVEGLAHRGPDSTGCQDLGAAVLAQQRLSILDPTPSGFQPMESSDGRHWIVHNGEIYNFLELADELAAAGHEFRTETDTEVILAAYARWGTSCVERFNGIWAFALWDREQERLFLSRDRLGVKPLFYAEHRGGIAFASEIKGLLALPDVSRDPEPAAIRDFLLDAMVDHSDRTFFRSVRRLPAAHNLVLDRDARRTERYWGPPQLSDDVAFAPRPSDGDLVEELRALLIDSVALQLRSDVELGSCLSGGVDSSSIVTIASGLRSGTLARQRAHAERDALPQHAFFAEFREPGIDEREYVDAVVERTGVELHTVTPSADDFFDTLPSVMWHQDEPFGSASIIAQYHVMHLARETGVRVLLDGQGADELLAGYPRVRPTRLLGALRRRDLGTIARLAPTEAASILRSARRRPAYLASVLRHVSRAAARRVPFLARRRQPGWAGPGTIEAESLLRSPEAVEDGTLLAATLWDEVARTSLPALLRYEDRNSMAFGIEARVPFLDHRVVELTMRMPDRLKIDGDRRKAALLDAMRGIVAPQVLARRDKIGFVPPQDRWLREVVGRWSDLKRGPRAEEAGYLRPGTVARTLERIAAGAPTAVPWRILNLELWLRHLAD